MSEQQFYVVWNPARGLPRYRHDTFDAAQSEAKRLAAQNPDEEFWVLASMGCAQTQNVVWRDCDPIPF